MTAQCRTLEMRLSQLWATWVKFRNPKELRWLQWNDVKFRRGSKAVQCPEMYLPAHDCLSSRAQMREINGFVPSTRWKKRGCLLIGKQEPSVNMKDWFIASKVWTDTPLSKPAFGNIALRHHKIEGVDIGRLHEISNVALPVDTSHATYLSDREVSKVLKWSGDLISTSCNSVSKTQTNAPQHKTSLRQY